MTIAKTFLCGTLAIATVVAASGLTSPAEAGKGRNAAIAAGVAGLALGAAAAAVAGNRSNGASYDEGPGPEAEGYEPDCSWQRQRVWVEGLGWQVQRVRNCD